MIDSKFFIPNQTNPNLSKHNILNKFGYKLILNNFLIDFLKISARQGVTIKSGVRY